MKNKMFVLVICLFLISGGMAIVVSAETRGINESEEKTLTIDEPIGEGTVEVDGEEVGLPYEETYTEGEKVEIEAVPGEGSRFYKWTGDLGETALLFDGEQDHVDIDMGDYSTSHLEVRTMVMSDSFANQRVVNTPEDESWSFYLFENQPSVNIYEGDHHNFDFTLESGEWYDLTFVYNDGDVTVSVDGEAIGTETLHTGDLQFSDLEFGRRDDESYFEGGIAEVEMVINGDDQIGHWSIYEGQGETIRDQSGHENHGNISGAEWIDVKPFLEFDGDDDHVDTPLTPDEADLGDGGSLSAWIKFDSVGTSRYTGSWGDPRLYVGDSGDGDLQTGFGDDWSDEGSGSLSSNIWHHLVVTNDGSNTIGYLDGEEIHSYSSSLSGTNEDFLIGNVVGTNGIQGLMDDVRVYDRDLSAKEVTELYERKNIEDGLLAYWPMNEGIGGTVYDESGNEKDGDIRGAEWTDYLSVAEKTKNITMGRDRELTPFFYQNSSVQTKPAEEVTHTGAELHGNITDVDHPEGAEVHFEYREAGEDWRRTIEVSADGDFYSSDPVGYAHDNGDVHIDQPLERGESRVYRYYEMGSGCDLRPHLRARSTEEVGGTSFIWDGYQEEIPSGREFEVEVEFTEGSEVNIWLDGELWYSGIDVEENYEKIYFTSYEYSGSSGDNSLRLLNSEHVDSDGSFSYEISGLYSGIEYEYRAVAYVDGERIVGENETFETEEITAQVATDAATNVTHVGAELHGEITGLSHPEGAEVHYEYKETGDEWPGTRTLQVAADGDFYPSDPVGFAHDNGYVHIDQPIERGGTKIYRYHELGSGCDLRPHLRSSHTDDDAGDVFVWSGTQYEVPDVREFEVEVEFTEDHEVDIWVDGELWYTGIDVGEDLEEIYFTSYEWSGSSGDNSLRLLNSDHMDSNGTFSYELSDLSSGTEYEYRAVAYVNGEKMVGDEETFETEEITAEVATDAATNVTHVGAELHGEITGLSHPEGAEFYYEYKEAGDEWPGSRTLQVVADGDFYSTDPLGFAHDNGYVHFNQPIERGGSKVYRYHELGSGCELRPYLRTDHTEDDAGTIPFWSGYQQEIPSGREFEVEVEFTEENEVEIWLDGELWYTGIEVDEDLEEIYFTSYEYGGSSGDNSLRFLNSEHMDSDGTYSYELSGLSSGTVYEYRAVAYVDGEKMVGEKETFETEEITAEVETNEATDVTHERAKFEGVLSGLEHPYGSQVYFEYKGLEDEDWNRTLQVSADGDFYYSDKMGFSHDDAYVDVEQPIEKGGSRVYRYHEMDSSADLRPHLRSDAGEFWEGGPEEIPVGSIFEVKVEFTEDSTVNISIDGELRYSGIEVEEYLEEIYFTSYEWAGSTGENSLRILIADEMGSDGSFSYGAFNLSPDTQYEYRAVSYVDGEKITGPVQQFETKEQEHFLLELEREGNGDIEVDGVEVDLPYSEVYANGTHVTLTAIPEEGWYFDGWTGDHTGTEEEITITVDGDKSLKAHFEEKDDHLLTVVVEGEGSTDPEEGTHTHYEGEEVSIEAIEDVEGWQFVGWTGDVPQGEEEEQLITIVMDEDKEVTAHFEIHEYELTIGTQGEGSTEPEEGTHTYEHGEEVDVTATAAEDWYFVEWTGDHESTDEEITVTMDENKEITAHFEEIQDHTLEINIEGEGITDPPEGAYTYEDGEEVTVIATAAEGWYFVEWTGDHESTDEEITIIMDEDKSITANFEEDIDYYNLTVNIEGEGSTDPEEGSHTYDEGTEVTVTATAAEGWYFVEWTGDHESTDEEIVLTMDEDKEITSHFEMTEYYELTVNIEGQGTVEIEPDQEEYEDGTEVILTAEPDEGYYFSGWTGDHEGTEEEIVIIMDENKVITAHFEEVDEYDLTIAIEGEGFTDPEEGAHTYEEGTEVTVTATADEGWYFVGWTGDHEGTEEEIVVIMYEDKEITAKFEEDLDDYELTVNVEGEGSTDPEEGSHTYEEGTDVTITATADAGWYFVNWTGDHESTEDEIVLTMDENKNITANFGEDVEHYNLTVSVEGEGSTDPSEGTHTYEEDTEVTVTATAAEDWYFVNWTGDHEGDEEQINITMDEDKNITAWFAVKEHDLTVNIEGEGTVTDHEGFDFEDGDTKNYTEMTEVNLIADAGEPWYFVNWTGDHEGTEEEIVLTMDEDKEITANFGTDLETYDLTIDIEGEGSTEPEEGTHTYEEEEVVTVEATPAENWQFVGWTGDETGVEPKINMTMDEDKSITAVFEEDIEHHELNIVVDGEGEIWLDIGPDDSIDEVVEDELTEEFIAGTSIDLIADPDDGWEFIYWEGNYPEGEKENDEITITVDENKTLTAYFEEITYDLTVDIEGEGSVEVDPDRDEYEEGTEVILSAVSEEKWEFVEWSGDVPGGEEGKEITIVMDEDKEITAVFEEKEEPKAEFVVTNFDVEVDELEITVTADVENVGDAEGTIDLVIAGEAAKTLTLLPGEDETIDYTYEFDEEGEYTVELDDEFEIVTVEKEDVDEEEGIDVTIIIGFIVIIVVVIAAIVYVMKSSEESETVMEEEIGEEEKEDELFEEWEEEG